MAGFANPKACSKFGAEKALSGVNHGQHPVQFGHAVSVRGVVCAYSRGDPVQSDRIAGLLKLNKRRCGMRKMSFASYNEANNYARDLAINHGLNPSIVRHENQWLVTSEDTSARDHMKSQSKQPTMPQDRENCHALYIQYCMMIREQTNWAIQQQANPSLRQADGISPDGEKIAAFKMKYAQEIEVGRRYNSEKDAQVDRIIYYNNQIERHSQERDDQRSKKRQEEREQERLRRLRSQADPPRRENDELNQRDQHHHDAVSERNRRAENRMRRYLDDVGTQAGWDTDANDLYLHYIEVRANQLKAMSYDELLKELEDIGDMHPSEEKVIRFFLSQHLSNGNK